MLLFLLVITMFLAMVYLVANGDEGRGVEQASFKAKTSLLANPRANGKEDFAEGLKGYSLTTLEEGSGPVWQGLVCDYIENRLTLRYSENWVSKCFEIEY